MTQLFKEKKGIQSKKPKWCSEDLWQTLTGLMVGGMLSLNVVFSKAERKVLRKRKKIKPSIWSEQHRVLIKSRLPGLWKNSVTPYLVGIMDAADLPFVREIIVCKAPQTGVSECTHNFIGSRIDMDPGDVLYTFPDEKTTKENFQDRIQPMILNSVRLSSYLTGYEKDLSVARINLQHMTIYGAWAGSDASLANKPIRYAVSDEIDKSGFGEGKKEASPLDLVDKRLITFRDICKHFKISSPSVESGNIWQELNHNTDIIFDYHAKCPFCGKVQLMRMEQVKWDGGGSVDPKDIKNKKLAWYKCEDCKGHWDDNVRDMAIRQGDWIARGTLISIDTYLEKFRPVNIGFHLPAWLSHFVSLSDCAAAFIKSHKSKKKLKDFRNGFEARPWEEYEVLASHEDKEVLKCKCDLPPQVAPQSAVALTVGADMQKLGFPYVVRAWAKDWTSWNIDYGQLGRFSDLEELLFEKVYPVENSDRTLRIWRAGLDTGGGKYKKDISSTEEAYLWLQRVRRLSAGRCRVFGTKGSSNPLPTKLKMGAIMNRTPSGKALKMGMRLIMLDPDQLKDLFYNRMEKAINGEHGGAWLHKKTTMAYARQITAERKIINPKGVETWEAIRKDNHYLDCECIAAAVADWEWPGGGVNLFPDPEGTHHPEKREIKIQTGTGNKRPGWFKNR